VTIEESLKESEAREDDPVFLNVDGERLRRNTTRSIGNGEVTVRIG
jgi:hypothetical protein